MQVSDTNRAPYHDGIKRDRAPPTSPDRHVSRATQVLIETLRARAAVHWGVDPARVEWKGGQVWRRGRKTTMDLSRLAALAP